MFRTTRAAVGAFASAALVFGLAACSTDEEAGPTLEELQSQAAASAAAGAESPSSEPESMTPEETAAQHAETAFREFLEVSNTAHQSPKRFARKQLEAVAISTQLAETESSLNVYGAQGIRQTGDLKIASLDLIDVKLANDVDNNKIPTVLFNVCYDTTEVDIVDKNGKSTITEDVPERTLTEVGVSNYEYPDGPWLVAFPNPKPGEAC